MKILFLSFLLVFITCDTINTLTVVSPIELGNKQSKPIITMTDFSYRKGNLDIYRYLILAEPFDGCSSLSISQENRNLIEDFFVLVDGKNCSHKLKTHNAKEIGAIGVIILNDDKNMINQPYYGAKDPRMLSFLIDEDEGLTIKNYMTINETSNIFVRLNYQSPKSNLDILYIWVSAIDHNSYVALHLLNDTLRDFPQIAEAIDWKPRYVFYGCNKNNSQSGYNVCNDKIATKLSCACGGEFCSPAQISTTSNTIVIQDIRQKQIFRMYPQQYFAYVKGIQKKCLQKYKMDKNIDTCSSKVASDLGMDLTSINDRVEQSVKYCNNSVYKDLLFDKIVYSKIGQYPAITLNNQIIHYSSKTDFQQILCKKLQLQKQPNCNNILVTINDEGMPWYIWLFLILGIATAGAFVIMWYRKKINKDMNKQIRMQVDTAISHYYTFNETQLK